MIVPGNVYRARSFTRWNISIVRHSRRLSASSNFQLAYLSIIRNPESAALPDTLTVDSMRLTVRVGSRPCQWVVVGYALCLDW
jgi:hypothetical protein